MSTAEECRAFFRDLCTPAELQALADRWAVVELLRRRPALPRDPPPDRRQRHHHRPRGALPGRPATAATRSPPSAHARPAPWISSQRLKVAVQKSGRLTEHSLDLLVRCGLKYSRGKDQLLCYGENMPLDVLLVRDDDIPDLVQEDVCDLGIVGLNVVEEKRLGFVARGADAAVRAAAAARLRPLPAVHRGAGGLQLLVGRASLDGRQAHRDHLPEHPRRAGCASRASRPRSSRCRARSRSRPRLGPRRPDLRPGLHRQHARGQSPARGRRPCSRARRC